MRFLLFFLLAAAAWAQAPLTSLYICTDVGADDAYVPTCDPADATVPLAQRVIYRLVATEASAGATTLQVPGQAAKAIKHGGADPITGTIPGGAKSIDLRYDPVGDVFEVIGGAGGVASVNTRTGAVTLDKTDVALGSVANYSLATQGEAEAGATNEKYMSPLRTAQAIQAIGGGTVTTYSVVIKTVSFTSQTSIGLTHNFNSLKQVEHCYLSDEAIGVDSFTRGLNASTWTFSDAVSGECVLVAGTGLFSNTVTAGNSVVVTHNLNTKATIATCYLTATDEEIGVDSITRALNTVTVNFSDNVTAECDVVGLLAVAAAGGSGNVSGPVSSTDGRAAIFDGSTGQAIKEFSSTGVVYATSGVLSTVTGATGCFVKLDGTCAAVSPDATSIQSVPVCADAPTNAQALVYDSTAVCWKPQNQAGGGSVTAGAGISVNGSEVSVAAATVPSFARCSLSTDLSFASIPAGGYASLTYSCPEAIVGDHPQVAWPQTLPANIMGIGIVTANGTIEIRLQNTHPTSSIQPPTASFPVWLPRSF